MDNDLMISGESPVAVTRLSDVQLIQECRRAFRNQAAPGPRPVHAKLIRNDLWLLRSPSRYCPGRGGAVPRKARPRCFAVGRRISHVGKDAGFADLNRFVTVSVLKVGYQCRLGRANGQCANCTAITESTAAMPST